MKPSKAGLVVIVGACILLALMTVFAVELTDSQARSKSDVKGQVHDRAVLAAALIDSLFQSVQSQIPQDTKSYGGKTVSIKALEVAAQQDIYLAVIGPDGHILASSSGFNDEARASLPTSAALAIVRSGHTYGLGNYSLYGSTGAIDFAVAFPTPFGTRILLTGLSPTTLSAFIANDLKTIPGVKGASNYLLDGNGIVLASSNQASPVGHGINQEGALEALSRPSFDSHGTYFSQVQLTNSTWRMVLSSPDGALFANVSGARRLVPWLIFGAFAIVALAALALGWRVLRSAEELGTVNLKLAKVNGELTHANVSLERRAAELVRSNEDLDQFASIASHDLQEPLRKVRTFTEQLVVMEGDNVSERGHEFLLRANAAAERMQRLIEDLLKFSRVSTQARPFVEVDLAEVAQDVVADLDAQVAESGAVVRVGDLPTISADRLQMRQLLQNLVSNALKFRRPGVTPEVDVSAVTEADIVRLTVEDNGIGFDPRYRLRIFRVFERLHGRTEYPGTGIGLALCRKIADRHGGSIEADSQPGSGSTFTVLLPITHQVADMPALEHFQHFEHPEGAAAEGKSEVRADV